MSYFNYTISKNASDNHTYTISLNVNNKTVHFDHRQYNYEAYDLYKVNLCMKKDFDMRFNENFAIKYESNNGLTMIFGNDVINVDRYHENIIYMFDAITDLYKM